MCKVRWLHPAGLYAARSRVFFTVMPTTWGRGGQHLDGVKLAGDPGEGHAVCLQRPHAADQGLLGIVGRHFNS
jgi:hypothetical protein